MKEVIHAVTMRLQKPWRVWPLLGWFVAACAVFLLVGGRQTVLSPIDEAVLSKVQVAALFPGWGAASQGPLAVCVSGTGEFADATAGALVRFFAALPFDVKVFVAARLDEHAYKLAALGGSAAVAAHVAAVQLVADIPGLKNATATVNRTVALQGEPAEAAAARIYLAGRCAAMVEQFESEGNAKFKWVANAGLGQLWGPPPASPFPLAEGAYTVPALASRAGINPLFGVGGRDAGLAAAAGRLAHLAAQAGGGQVQHLELDTLHRMFLQSKNVAVDFANFPFCTLTRPKAAAAAAAPADGLPAIHASSSAGATNGAPCWPCSSANGTGGAVLKGGAAWVALTAGPPKWGVALPPLGGAGGGLQICASGAEAGEDTGASRPPAREECVRAVQAVAGSVGRWEGADAGAVCARAYLGPMSLLGTEYGGWTLFPSVLSSQSVVYSFGVGKDISWDLAIMKQFGLHVYAFDNTPVSMGWLKEQHPPASWHHNPFLLGTEDGNITLALPKGHGVSFATLEASARGFQDKTTVTLPARTLETLMRDLGHAKVDVLKVDIEGAEFGIIDKWVAAKRPPAACQLLLEFHGRLMADGAARRAAAVAGLESLGFLLGHSNVDDFGSDDCLFYSPDQCGGP